MCGLVALDMSSSSFVSIQGGVHFSAIPMNCEITCNWVPTSRMVYDEVPD